MYIWPHRPDHIRPHHLPGVRMDRCITQHCMAHGVIKVSLGLSISHTHALCGNMDSSSFWWTVSALPRWTMPRESTRLTNRPYSSQHLLYSLVQWYWFSAVTGCTWAMMHPVTSKNQSLINDDFAAPDRGTLLWANCRDMYSSSKFGKVAWNGLSNEGVLKLCEMACRLQLNTWQGLRFWLGFLQTDVHQRASGLQDCSACARCGLQRPGACMHRVDPVMT